MVDFGSPLKGTRSSTEQGMSFFEATPLKSNEVFERNSELFRGLEENENAAPGEKMTYLDGH